MYSDVHELNFSKIKTYLECPLLYKYKYMDGRKEGLVAASSLGVSIHRALEEYHRNSNDPSELLSYYDDCWLGAGYTSAAQQMEYYLKGKKCWSSMPNANTNAKPRWTVPSGSLFSRKANGLCAAK